MRTLCSKLIALENTNIVRIIRRNNSLAQNNYAYSPALNIIPGINSMPSSISLPQADSSYMYDPVSVVESFIITDFSFQPRFIKENAQLPRSVYKDFYGDARATDTSRSEDTSYEHDVTDAPGYYEKNTTPQSEYISTYTININTSPITRPVKFLISPAKNPILKAMVSEATGITEATAQEILNYFIQVDEQASRTADAAYQRATSFTPVKFTANSGLETAVKIIYALKRTETSVKQAAQLIQAIQIKKEPEQIAASIPTLLQSVVAKEIIEEINPFYGISLVMKNPPVNANTLGKKEKLTPVEFIKHKRNPEAELFAPIVESSSSGSATDKE
ncbi:hypothetical protein ACFL5G_04800 [Candidatus Margulisiibacteriota bacterium]